MKETPQQALVCLDGGQLADRCLVEFRNVVDRMDGPAVTVVVG